MLSNSMAAGCGHMDGVVAIAIVFAATYLPSFETSYQQQHCQQEQMSASIPVCHFRVPVDSLSYLR